MNTRPRIWWPVLVVLMAAAAALLCWRPWAPPAGTVQGTQLASFPAVDTAGLNPTQQAIVEQARDQFQAPHPGTFYAEGAEQPWCADFVSWIMNAAGHPLVNPNSGSWRIPGVATLQDYYAGTGRFRRAGYLPQVGDVVLYGDASPFHQHTNLVLGYGAGTVTTIGGNERGGVRVHRFALADDPGVVGFGVL